MAFANRTRTLKFDNEHVLTVTNHKYKSEDIFKILNLKKKFEEEYFTNEELLHWICNAEKKPASNYQTFFEFILKVEYGFLHISEFIEIFNYDCDLPDWLILCKIREKKKIVKKLIINEKILHYLNLTTEEYQQLLVENNIHFKFFKYSNKTRIYYPALEKDIINQFKFETWNLGLSFENLILSMKFLNISNEILQTIYSEYTIYIESFNEIDDFSLNDEILPKPKIKENIETLKEEEVKGIHFLNKCSDTGKDIIYIAASERMYTENQFKLGRTTTRNFYNRLNNYKIGQIGKDRVYYVYAIRVNHAKIVEMNFKHFLSNNKVKDTNLLNGKSKVNHEVFNLNFNDMVYHLKNLISSLEHYDNMVSSDQERLSENKFNTNTSSFESHIIDHKNFKEIKKKDSKIRIEKDDPYLFVKLILLFKSYKKTLNIDPNICNPEIKRPEFIKFIEEYFLINSNYTAVWIFMTTYLTTLFTVVYN